MNIQQKTFILLTALTSSFSISAMVRNKESIAEAFSPLHYYAIAPRSVLTLKSLLERGANPNATTNSGATPLHWAVRWNNLSAFNLLITAGADVNAVNRFGRSSLHWAAGACNAEMVKRLLAAGADRARARYRGDDRETPLKLVIKKYRGHPQTNEYKLVIALLQNRPMAV